MDKNNDIKMSHVSKWEAAPKNMGTLFTYINLVIGMACSLPSEIRDNLYDLMNKTLDEYNELEARHQKDTGMISEYEEENKNLKSELDIKTDECDALISRVFKQDEEYTKLKVESKKLRENSELCMKAHLRLLDESTKLATENEDLRSKCESKEDVLQKMIKEVTELEKEKIVLEKKNEELEKTLNDMRHKRDFIKKEYEKLKEANKSLRRRARSCPVACECENFKPKVHHSYDPLDDLPDLEHS